MQNKTLKILILSAVFYSFLFQIHGFAADDLSSLKVYPNPVRCYAGESAITFENLTNQTRIQIYTIRGRMLFEKEIESGSLFRWDVKNQYGHNVASGIYVYLVTNRAGGKQSGKLVVQR
ncbi:MAG: T9SS type A sorting domain-containing protein [Elusimicrobia bacterium]|nr:T9SS type A sorting domain-containing protein [Candidatus Obscuribacterium magneticum]